MYVVTNSPWPSRLPNGTEITLTEPRPNSDGNWFKRSDGIILFPEEKGEEDGKFKLHSNEFENK